MRHDTRFGRGFVAAEGAAAIAVLGVACCLGAVAGRQNRLGGGLAGSMANLKRIGEATGAYAADEGDRLWSFSWSPGNCPSQYPDLQSASEAHGAFANQAVDIVRRRFDENQSLSNDRFVAPWLSTLVLVDYLDEALPAEWAVSPGDEVRLGWQADPHNPPDLNEQGGEAWASLFVPFGSSYMLMPAFFAQDQRSDDGEPTIYQYPGQHDLYFLPSGVTLGGRVVPDVAFPSSKVHMAERASFFYGPRTAYFLHPEARVPVLMADGAVSVRTSADANLSFRPNNPEMQDATSVTDYAPNRIYDPPTMSGGSEDASLETHYKWTRRGLRGVDFSGERAE